MMVVCSTQLHRVYTMDEVTTKKESVTHNPKNMDKVKYKIEKYG